MLLALVFGVFVVVQPATASAEPRKKLEATKTVPKEVTETNRAKRTVDKQKRRKPSVATLLDKLSRRSGGKAKVAAARSKRRPNKVFRPNKKPAEIAAVERAMRALPKRKPRARR